MDENKKRIEKIYSRNRIKIPRQIAWNKQSTKKHPIVHSEKTSVIEPVIDMQCMNMAKSIATKVSNEQATVVMADYEYADLMNMTKDEQGNIKMISANVILVNKIISDIPILIQKELDKIENNKFYIRLGTFTGSKLLAGRGPNVEIKMSAIGNIETDLKSEFTEAGINQTIHRIYLEVKCNVIILTPFNSIQEQIVNQVLLAEGLIVGNTPNTYYNLEGINKDNMIDVIE